MSCFGNVVASGTGNSYCNSDPDLGESDVTPHSLPILPLGTVSTVKPAEEASTVHYLLGYMTVAFFNIFHR